MITHPKDIVTIEKGKCSTVLIKPDVRIACGVETFFFPVNSRRGLKVFAEKKNAQNSLRRQKKAAKHGLGPKVYSDKVFEVVIPLGFERLLKDKLLLIKDLFNMFEDNIGYGYYTQIIKLVDSEDDYTDEEEKELVNALYKLFPDVSLDDIHDGNVGRIKGKLVMIDFGDESAS
jgi:hypothetical protein